MEAEAKDVDLSGITDPQRPVAFTVGLILLIVGIVSLTGLVNGDVIAPGLVLGFFGVPFWLGVTAVVAGLIGILLSFFAGAGTTFNKVASGLVLPPVIFLAIADWAFGMGGVFLVLTAVMVLLALVFVAIGHILLTGTWLMFLLPVVAVLTLADWVLGLTHLAPYGVRVNLFTIGLLILVMFVVGVIGYEGGRRMT